MSYLFNFTQAFSTIDNSVSTFTLPEFLATVEPLIFFVIGMAIYSLFVFKFYRFIARRDIFELHIERYKHKGLHKFLHGVKSFVPAAGSSELFIVGAQLDGRPALFIVESGTKGLMVEADAGMGVRAAGMGRLLLQDVAAARWGVEVPLATVRELLTEA